MASSNPVTTAELPRAPHPVDEDARWQRLLRCRDRRAGLGEKGLGETGDCPLTELYRPFLARDRFVLGHIGQSLDGRIATLSGDSRTINGAANILHLHRLRALADAVVVGAGTVAADDPRLTTRLCPGPSPVRVVLDPRRRLHPAFGLFCDGAAPTLVIAAAEHADGAVGDAEVVGVPAGPDGLDLGAVVQALAERGLTRLFVEGGGITISRFLAAGRLDRLQVTVAPVLMGSGRPSLALPAIASMAGALRPAVRRFMLGDDVLFECCFDG